jgi:hypothetical protein
MIDELLTRRGESLPEEHKKSSPDKSEELTMLGWNSKLLSDLSVTQIRVMELAPYSACSANEEQVVKASKGHIPQPFLISNLKKNWRKDKRESIQTAKKNYLSRDLYGLKDCREMEGTFITERLLLY